MGTNNTGKDESVPACSLPTRASSMFNTFGRNIRSLFSRTIVAIKGVIEPRSVGSRLNCNVASFIKSVINKNEAEITVDECRALNDELERVLKSDGDAGDEVFKGVSLALSGMSRGELGAFRSKLLYSRSICNVPVFSENNFAALYIPANVSLAHSISRDADLCALNALKLIDVASDPDNPGIDIVFSACRLINEHLSIVTPTKDSVSKGTGPLSDKDQMKLIATSKDSAVLKWFARQTPHSQGNVLKTLHRIATGTTPQGLVTDDEFARLRAFCNRMKEVLPKSGMH